MVIAALLAAQAVIDPPSGTWRLDCQLTEGIVHVRSDGSATSFDRPVTPIRIFMEARGRRIASVRIDGPPEFSSSRGLRAFVATRELERAGLVQASEPPLAGNRQWRGRFGRRAIRLYRDDSEIMLTLERHDPEAFSGSWWLREDLEEQSLSAGSGEITCRAPAPPADGSTGA